MFRAKKKNKAGGEGGKKGVGGEKYALFQPQAMIQRMMLSKF